MSKLTFTTEELGTFCLSLYHLVRSGLGIADAFSLLAADESRSDRRALLEQMAAQADEGMPLDRVLEQAGCFPAYLSAMTAVGRQTGRTEEALQALSTYYEHRAALEKQQRAAVIYPAVLAGVLLTVILILLIWVLPVFERAYQQLGISLTGVAGLLLRLGGLLKTILPLLGVLLAAALLMVLRLWRKGLPVGEKTGFLVDRARFVHALSMCLRSGMTPEEAVRYACLPVEADSPFRKRLDACADLLKQGGSLPAALRESEVLSHADCRLLEAGFRAGSGEQVTETLSRRLTGEAELALEMGAARFEPVLVLTLAVLVGAVLLSVMLPLVDVMSAIG